MQKDWSSRKFWFCVGTWLFAFMLQSFLMYSSNALLDKKLITDAIWQTVNTGSLTAFLMYTGAIFGLYGTSNLMDKAIYKKGKDNGSDSA